MHAIQQRRDPEPVSQEQRPYTVPYTLTISGAIDRGATVAKAIIAPSAVNHRKSELSKALLDADATDHSPRTQ